MAERASVVVPTVDRPDALRALLHSLTLQTHDDFEVIVVVGPPHDATLRALDTFAHPIKVLTCPERNLSMARNIGVAAAASDIVAFVDDDGLVEPRWLEELIAPLADPAVAVAGGLVLDHHGTGAEYDGVVADRLGRVRKLTRPAPADLRAFPESWEFGYAPGGNAAYRVGALRAVGGFDERITYYLDETDTCLRLIDAGWMVTTANGAVMHHKSLPSSVRNDRRAVVDWTQIIRSRVYFARRHATAVLGADAVTAAIEHMLGEQRALVVHEVASGRLTAAEQDAALQSIAIGHEQGEHYAALGPVLPLVDATRPPPFKRSGAHGDARRHQRVVALSAGVVDALPAGVRTPLEVRLVVPGAADVTTVDLIEDVWMHRTPPRGQLRELARLLATMHVDLIVTDLPHAPTSGTVPVVEVDDMTAWLADPEAVSRSV